MGVPLYLELEMHRDPPPKEQEFAVEEQKPKYEIDYTISKVGLEIDIK